MLRLMAYSGKAYVDNGSATCRFNSPEFIDMLKFSTELNREEDWSYAPDSAVFSGKQMILISTTEDPVYEYQYANALFRGRAKLIGFPTNTGTGANMAPRLRVGMSVNSKEKAGVWDFMEYLLGDSFQVKSGGVRIRRDIMEPILKAQIEASVGMKKALGLFCKDDQSNVVRSCGGQILAEFNQLGIDLAVVLKAEKNEDLALAGICGRNFVAFYLISASDLLTDDLRIFYFAFLFLREQNFHFHKSFPLRSFIDGQEKSPCPTFSAYKYILT